MNPEEPTTYNILLFGETGAGKSTTINALANYLRFNSFDDAISGQFTQVITSKITLLDPETYEDLVIQHGDPNDPNERHNEDGASITQSPRDYKLKYRDKVIRIIDTPGMGDTGGLEVDKENFQKILQHLEKKFTQLHAICFLIKTNTTRKTAYFAYTLNKLLTSLHRSACANIIFCFTFCRNSLYGPGDGYQTLKGFLKENELQGQRIELKTNQNCFYIDNEAFRFLLAKKYNYPFKEDREAEYRESWDKSVQNITKMLDNIVKLEPHSLRDTFTIIKCRKWIENLDEPINELEAKIQAINSENKNNKENLRKQSFSNKEKNVGDLGNSRTNPQLVKEFQKEIELIQKFITRISEFIMLYSNMRCEMLLEPYLDILLQNQTVKRQKTSYESSKFLSEEKMEKFYEIVKNKNERISVDEIEQLANKLVLSQHSGEYFDRKFGIERPKTLPSKIPVSVSRSNSLKSNQNGSKIQIKQKSDSKTPISRKTSFKSYFNPPKSQIPTFTSNATKNEPDSENSNSRIPVSVRRLNSFKSAKLSQNIENPKPQEQIGFLINPEQIKDVPMKVEFLDVDLKTMNLEYRSDSDEEIDHSVKSELLNNENHNSEIMDFETDKFHTNDTETVFPKTFAPESGNTESYLTNEPELFDRKQVDQENVHSEPVHLESFLPKQVVPEPIVPKPIVPEPVVPEPAVPKPVVPKPIVPEPIVPEPIVPEPVVQEPAVPEPIVLEPVIPELIVPNPVVPEQVVPEPIDPEMAVLEPIVSELAVPEPVDLEPVEPKLFDQNSVEPEQVIPKPTPKPRKSIIKLSNSNSSLNSITCEFTPMIVSIDFESAPTDVNKQLKTNEPVVEEPTKQNEQISISIENLNVSEIESRPKQTEIRIPAKRHSLKGNHKLSLKIPENLPQSEQLIKTPLPLDVSSLMSGLLSTVQSEDFIEKICAKPEAEPIKQINEKSNLGKLENYENPEILQNFQSKTEPRDVVIDISIEPKFEYFDKSFQIPTENTTGSERIVSIVRETETNTSENVPENNHFTKHSTEREKSVSKPDLTKNPELPTESSITSKPNFSSPNSKSVSNLYTSPKTPTSASSMYSSWSTKNLNSPKSASSSNSALHQSHGNLFVEEIDSKSPNKSIIKTTSYSTGIRGSGLLSPVSQGEDAFTFNFDDKSSLSRQFLQDNFPELSQSTSNQNQNTLSNSNPTNERSKFFELKTIPDQIQQQPYQPSNSTLSKQDNQKKKEPIQPQQGFQKQQKFEHNQTGKSTQFTVKIKSDPQIKSPVIEIHNNKFAQPKNQSDTVIQIDNIHNKPKLDQIKPPIQNRNDPEFGEISHQTNYLQQGTSQINQSTQSVNSFNSAKSKKSFWHKSTSKTTYKNIWKGFKRIF